MVMVSSIQFALVYGFYAIGVNISMLHVKIQVITIFYVAISNICFQQNHSSWLVCFWKLKAGNFWFDSLLFLTHISLLSILCLKQVNALTLAFCVFTNCQLKILYIKTFHTFYYNARTIFGTKQFTTISEEVWFAYNFYSIVNKIQRCEKKSFSYHTLFWVLISVLCRINT